MLKFSSEIDVYKWANNNFPFWIERLNKKEKNDEMVNSIFNYSGTSYKLINRHLRNLRNYNDSILYPEILKDIDNIETIINKFSLEEDIIVYRLIDRRVLEILLEENTYQETSFISTTLVPDFSKLKDIWSDKIGKECILELRVNKNINFVPIIIGSKSRLDESELLLEKNLTIEFIKKKLIPKDIRLTMKKNMSNLSYLKLLFKKSYYICEVYK